MIFPPQYVSEWYKKGGTITAAVQICYNAPRPASPKPPHKSPRRRKGLSEKDSDVFTPPLPGAQASRHLRKAAHRRDRKGKHQPTPCAWFRDRICDHCVASSPAVHDCGQFLLLLTIRTTPRSGSSTHFDHGVLSRSACSNTSQILWIFSSVSAGYVGSDITLAATRRAFGYSLQLYGGREPSV